MCMPNFSLSPFSITSSYEREIDLKVVDRSIFCHKGRVYYSIFQLWTYHRIYVRYHELLVKNINSLFVNFPVRLMYMNIWREIICTYLVSVRQRVVSYGQSDKVSWSKQFHNRLLVGGLGDVSAIYLQYTVSHPELPALSGSTSGNHLQRNEPVKQSNTKITDKLTCEIKIPGSLAPKGILE